VAADAYAHDGLVARLTDTRYRLALAAPRDAVAHALRGTDSVLEAIEGEMRDVQMRLEGSRQALQAVVAAAVVVAFVALLLLWLHARGRRRIAELTARRTADAKAQDARRLESLSLLAGGVAHDFNNLLVSVLANADLARELVPRDAPARECIDEISSSAQRCAELSRQMLAYCGRGRLRVESIDLNALAREVAGELRPRMPDHSELRWKLEPDLPEIRVDAARIRQVLSHVLANAAEALSPEGGAITVATSVRTLDRRDLEGLPWQESLEPGRYVCVAVSDDGCGMDEHTLARVFDPFFTTKPDGRGFGLALSSGLVRAHRGTVLAESAPRGGTTIRILLPLAAREVPAAARDIDYRAPVAQRRQRRATG
jgi:signal transduction histidine kinase